MAALYKAVVRHSLLTPTRILRPFVSHLEMMSFRWKSMDVGPEKKSPIYTLTCRRGLGLGREERGHFGYRDSAP